jgi:hypothetical protein
MTNPFKYSVIETPAVNHTDARYVKLSYANGSTVVTPSGFPGGWPALALQTNGVVANEILSIPSGGNRTTRVFADSAIDELMRLDNMAGAKYKCKFVAMRVRRYVLTTALNTTNERLFQYGDQGSTPGSQLDGGWVARINAGNLGAPFVQNSISVAIHLAYNPDANKATTGTQTSEGYCDPIAITSAYTDGQMEAGLSILACADITDPDNPVARIYIDGVLADSDAMPVTSWPLPGKSTNGPGSASASNGFCLFNQSVNDTSGNPLKSADVTPVWIGEAFDTAHLARLAAAHHADPLANPYL